MSRMQRVRRSLAARLRASARAARRAGPLLVLALLLVGIGVALRVQHLGRPGAFAFDEHHFVENARRFLSRRHDANDHPALGKLLMLPSMWLLGDRGMGWRGAQLVAGLALIVLAGTLGARLFRDRRAGWLAAAFVAADGLLVVYSRVALLDGFLGCFAMLAVWLSVRARGPLGHAGAGAAIGAAAAIKVSGAALGLPALALALRSRRPVLSALALGAAPVVFTAQGVLGRVISRESASPLNFWRSTLEMVRVQSQVHDFKHPLTSRWFTWYLPERPIVLRLDAGPAETLRATVTLGNLALWWVTVALLVALPLLAGWLVARRIRHGAGRAPRWARATLTLAAFGGALQIPWVFGVRDSYLYHSLPTYGLLLVALGGLVARAYRRVPHAALVYVSAVLLVAAQYSPVWGHLELTRAGYEARLFLPRWR